MKFATLALGSLLVGGASAFAPPHARASSSSSMSSALKMAVDMPPPATENAPAVVLSRGGAPQDVRYSEFLTLVNKDRVEKVTFSADGTQLLGVDVDGARIKIEALPNDPDLLTQLTNHKVDVTVLPVTEASGLGELAQSLIFPAILFAGLFFLSRNANQGGGMPGGGPGNPMGFGKSKAEIQMIPDT
eukprot:scaffold91900_cov59-Attheya_sp.AAC.12